MRSRWTLRALRWSYSAFIIAASLVAARGALPGTHHGTFGAHAVLVLAVTEASAAVALLIEPLERAAWAVLLVVYAIAAAASIVSGEWLALPRLAFYAVTATYIVLTSRASNSAMEAAV